MQANDLDRFCEVVERLPCREVMRMVKVVQLIARLLTRNSSGGVTKTLKMDSTSVPQSHRLFSIFETSDETVLYEQCVSDLGAWGMDSFQCRQKAKRILENARKADIENPRPVESLRSEGVTSSDHEWYWRLPSTARAVMPCFDDEVRSHMWFDCHARNH